MTREAGFSADEGRPLLSGFTGDTRIEQSESNSPDIRYYDAEFGGPEARRRLENKLLRKIDTRMSILVVIYILNYIDRNNAAAARLRGFEEDLNLHGTQFATLLSIFYVGYVSMQVPSNVFLNYIGRPSLYLPACMVVCGIISAVTGITHNFTGAFLVRLCLGFVEGTFFPGALFLLSKWYTRKELGVRNAILYCGSLSSNAFGGLVAAGILDGMQGRLGHGAWRWLFYIEGAMTVAVALVAMFVLPDFPLTTNWLTPAERRLAELRMEEDAGVIDEEDDVGFAWRGFQMALRDWKTWWLSITLASYDAGLSFNAYFPTLTATMGYSPTITLLLCAPPWVFATIIAFIVARHSDKTGERAFHIMIPFMIGMVGFIISLSTMNTACRYVALFLAAQSFSGIIVFFTWISSSIPRPPSKRAVALAIINSLSHLGNVAGSYVWPSVWGPTYRNSYAISLSCLGLGVVLTFIFREHLRRENMRLAVEEQKALERGGPIPHERQGGQEVPVIHGETGFRYLL